MPQSLESLQARRRRLLSELAHMGDLRQGSLTEVYRRCGKKSCWCAHTDQPGHGPFYAFTRKVQGKTQTLQLRPGPLLSKLQREVQAYRNFRERCEEIVALSEKICQARPVEGRKGSFKKNPPGCPGGDEPGSRASGHPSPARTGAPWTAGSGSLGDGGAAEYA